MHKEAREGHMTMGRASLIKKEHKHPALKGKVGHLSKFSLAG